MTAKTNSFPAPKFSQAVNGVLKLSEIKESTEAVVPAYTGSEVRDSIRLFLRTTHGGEHTYILEVLGIPGEAPFLFKIPKDHLALRAVAGDRAFLKYEVTRQSGNVGSSAEIDVGLEP
ncbi:hypothetical protein [Pseudomonas moraviensis]|uniref:hypothetical protein n=1 Tax=Pseudomonas moraviensis TaxID=321662 RepID=UPI0020927557|nr:hypothetical protein [Pseudomonas moraviensis]UST64955.1 hypothetical protein NF673_04140 [Pseudomonas moraviensis]UVL46997.1 hypothetical protein LOY57_04155 [Pseudomonas moraviensis]